MGERTPAKTRFAGYGCGSLLALFGATMIVGAAVSFGEKHPPTGDLVTALLFGVAPLALGAFWVYRTLQAQRKEAWEVVERKVLTFAMQRGGVVTAMEVAADTDLSFDEAKRYLDRLADQGHVEIIPTAKGLAYRFPGADSNPLTPTSDLHIGTRDDAMRPQDRGTA